MKMVAAKSFFRSRPFADAGLTLDADSDLFRHEDHVHPGARFSIGTAENYKDLSGQQKEMVGVLLKHKLAVYDNEENAKNGVIKDIDKAAKVDFDAWKKAQAPVKTMEVMIAEAMGKTFAPALKALADAIASLKSAKT